MEEILYLVLGAFLALAGGVISQLFQSCLQRRKEDVSLLFLAHVNLLAHHPLSDSENECQRSQALRMELTNIAIRIQSRKYRKIAVALTRFALDNIFRTQDELTSLTRDVQALINKPMMEEYEEEMKGLQSQARRALKREKEK